MAGLSPRQVLALWNLLFSGAQPRLSKLKPRLTAAERQELIAQGLITLEKRGRASHIQVTPKAWAYAAERLDAGFSRSKFAADALAGLLETLKHYLERNKLGLESFCACEPDIEHLEDRILDAYLEASGGRSNIRVRLSELRDLLHDIDRNALDSELIRMQKANVYNLVLWPIDDPRDIRPEDDDGALTVSGRKRHILYMDKNRP